VLKFNAPFSGTQVGKEAEGEPQQAGNKFEITYPYREEDRGIALVLLFLGLILLKVSPNHLEMFINLTFSPKV
jgi:hypothetical protein